MTKLHEELYALASQSESDAATTLNRCGDTARDLLEACRALLDVQSRRRHPLGQPDEHIATDAAEAASKARAAIGKAEGRT